MSKHVYAGVLRDEMIGFLEIRKNQGFKDGRTFMLESLDKYLVLQNTTEKLLTASVIDDWLVFACNGQRTRTINNYIGYYNSFAKYLHAIGIDVFVPEYVRICDNYAPYIFSEQEIERIFTVSDNIRPGKYVNPQVQFSVLLRILYGCGLRLSEALSLKKFDIDIEGGVIFIRNAKGNCDRFVPMEQALTKTLSLYYNLLLKDKSDDAWVFESDYAAKTLTRLKKSRTAKWAQLRFRRTLKEAGIDLLELPRKKRNICLNCLRHTFIVTSFRKQDLAGIDNNDLAASISVYVGHYRLTGTQRYLHMTAENSIDIINAANKYSKGMFPEIPSEYNSIVEQRGPLRLKPPPITVQENLNNECSKGVFPEVPQ